MLQMNIQLITVQDNGDFIFYRFFILPKKRYMIIISLKAGGTTEWAFFPNTIVSVKPARKPI